MPNWEIPREQLDSNMGLADAGQERVRNAENLAQAAATGKARYANGIPMAQLTSAAENGWTLCVWHGLTPSVDQNGTRAITGVCEACWKAFRQLRAIQNAQGSRPLDSGNLSGSPHPSAETTQHRPNAGGLAANPKPEAGGGPRDEGPDGVAWAKVEGNPGNQKPAGSAGDDGLDEFEAWLRRCGADT